MGLDLLSKRTRAVLSKKGFISSTPVQKDTIKSILDKKSVLIVSETGSGKTEASILPIFDILSENKEKRIFCLYITPLKALNRDVFERLVEMGAELEIDIDVRHGDTPTSQRVLQSKDPPHILITTPETFQAILVGKKFRDHLKNVEFVIVDEIHEIIGDKRGEQLLIGLERLKRLKNADFVRIGLSATVSNPKKVSESLNGSNTQKMAIIEPKKEKKTIINVFFPVKTVENFEEDLDHFSPKTDFIASQLSGKRSVLVFTNTRDNAEVLGAKLREIGEFSKIVGVHHSSLSKDSRLDTEQGLKKGNLKLVVATSSLALGIDIGHIDLVIQYSSPRRIDSLLQRVGRAGHRLSEVSEGRVLATDVDDIFESAVIAKLALSGTLEPMEFQEGSLDVLANQITAMGFEGTYTIELAFSTIKSAHPFRNLGFQEFGEVLNLLINLRIVKIAENGLLSIKKPAFSYFFSNLSMIKDQRKFEVLRIDSKEKIAQIDEEFASELEMGSSFICRGSYWKAISREGNKIFVDVASVAYNAPEWSGELMPVDFIVARQVEALRSDWMSEKKYYLGILDNNCVNEIEKSLEKEYQFKKGKLQIECGETSIVVRSFYGSKTNETLGRLVSSILSLRYGDSIGFKADSYRILVKFPGSYSRELIKEVLENIDSEKISQTLKIVLRNSNQFKQRFIQIAKKFGVVSKDAIFSKISIQRLVDAYFGTPVFEEAIEEYFFDKLDIEHAKDLAKDLKAGRIEVEFIEGLTAFGERFIERYNPEVVLSGAPLKKVYEIVKKRLEETKITIGCLNCNEFLGEFTVKAIDFACPRCNSRLIGIASRQTMKNLQKQDLDRKDAYLVKKARKTADLYLSYGKSAFFTLAGVGIGPETATRVLAKAGLGSNEERLIQEILKAEKVFARTKIFWKPREGTAT